MTTRGTANTEIISWIDEFLESENIVDYQINFTGKTEKGDGYAGEVVFVNVKGTTKDKGKVVLDLVVKHGKDNDLLRKTKPMRDAFEAEIHFYDKVLPVFKKFQSGKNVSNGFDSVPKCYFTLILEKMEVLILENLKTQNYELHDRTLPLNLNHLKAILTEYGKLHALSFALKDQNYSEFNSILRHGRVFEKFFNDQSLKDSFHKNNIEALDILSERGDETLRRKWENVLVKNSVDLMLDLMAEKEPQSVIIHGDSWNNNFMFKYKDDNKTVPSQVKILDWQVIELRSPAMDLSYFIYANSSQKELDRWEELMETYYASFSSFLRELGSDPEKLFTYADLKRHWKKYSLFGALFIATIMRFMLIKKEDAPAFEDLKEGGDIGSLMTLDVGDNDKDAYYVRLKAVLAHYFDSL